MKRLLLLHCWFLIALTVTANTIIVKNIEELKKANKQAKPGDIIILQNGEWSNVGISLNCNGTKEQPITFKAQTPGKVIITGNSELELGGNFIIVDGLYFINGFAGDNAVINFRIDKNQLANNCRVTNCVVNDFNNYRRIDENNWVLFYGKNNRLDHCSFLNKKNLGVLLAVILDDDRSRENSHSIDHNYFGVRLPLASNGGEIIRVGVSQHSQFNSNTQITDNFFEQCDGETEIISIKSASNIVRNNLFKECQGGVVLRHGDNNTVENNIFLGNDKEGTGGVRIINKGQWVVNNLFYKCRGVDFRSPLSVMNGIPNSPANRYVQVTDAVIANNTFQDCSPISLCEGSDTERTLPPANVLFLNNIFYNNRDSSIYRVFDNIHNISFRGNEVSKQVMQPLPAGFERTAFTTQKNDVRPFVSTKLPNNIVLTDSLQELANLRLGRGLSNDGGFSNLSLAKKIQVNAYNGCGAKWFESQKVAIPLRPLQVNCTNADEVYKQLERKEPVIIKLTGKEYILDKPFVISKNVRFMGNKKTPVKINTGNMLSVFVIAGNGNLFLQNLAVNGAGVKAANFISSDKKASSNHYNLSIKNCSIQNLDRKNGCENLFYAYKSMVADSIVMRNNAFLKNNCNGIIMTEEKDNKGYYNAEKIIMTQNYFNEQDGMLLDIYRGGNDESTMGPMVIFNSNKIDQCSNTTNDISLINLYGVQRSFIERNNFSGCNVGAALIRFEDAVRAAHSLRDNTMRSSGNLVIDKFVRAENNTVQ